MSKNGYKQVEQPRYLHRRSELGYTTHRGAGLPKEPEAVDAATQARFSRDARIAFDVERRQERLTAERRKLLALRDAVDERLVVVEKQLQLEQVA